MPVFLKTAETVELDWMKDRNVYDAKETGLRVPDDDELKRRTSQKKNIEKNHAHLEQCIAIFCGFTHLPPKNDTPTNELNGKAGGLRPTDINDY